jgi:hypothetical protein
MEDAKRRPGRSSLRPPRREPCDGKQSNPPVGGREAGSHGTIPHPEGGPLPPTPPQRTSREISPELVLVDRELMPVVRGDRVDQSGAELDGDVREAMLRMCELSDVNPPRIRRRRLVAYAGPATLWAEAVLLIAAHIPLGAI